MMKLLKMLAVCAALGASPLGMSVAAQNGGQTEENNGAQASGFELPGSRMHAFRSDVMEDDFHIAVSLPFGYGQGERTYPLLFALDGDGMFGMSSEIPRLLSFEGKVPPVIVATVVYGGMQQWFQKRARDFHSANGGAEKFLTALRDEILPFLEEQYPIDPGNRAIYGHSSAGLFAFYAGVEEPALFSRILATSPSLEEEPAWSQTFLEKIKASDTAFPKMYLSVDASETAMLAAVTPQVEALSVKMTPADLKFETLAEGSHMSVIPRAYAAGLQFLYLK